MEIVLLLLRQNLVMLLYLMIGYLVYRGKLVTSAGSAEIGKMLLYLVMPMAIVKSYIRDFSKQALLGLTVSFLAAALALALAVCISALLLRKAGAVRQFGAAFSNAGFIGIPLAQMTLGEEAVFYVASFVAILNILQWTYGVWLITGDKSCVSMTKLRTNPILISFAAGLVLLFAPISLPSPLMGMVSTIASMNGPLAMIVLGCYLAQVPLKTIFLDIRSYQCAAVRLVVIPLFSILLLCLVPGQYADIRMAVLLAASAPVGSNVAIFAQIYHADYGAAVKDVCLSTICSIVTMPLMMAAAGLVWR